jgi:MFS transporter, YNFM family, putative membrane transport protein
MHFDRRRVAVALAGCCTFLDLYTPQALLPSLAAELHVSEAEISLLISATTFAVALIAPFAGTVADVIGRKRVISTAMFLLVIPMALVALSTGLPGMVAWRFLQGLLLPPIFAVMIAYVSEEWPPAEATAVTAIFMSASSFGGFLGRFLTSVLAEYFGWRVAFVELSGFTLFCAIAFTVLLPRERAFVRAESLSSSWRQMLRHFRNPRLVATYGVGFSVLFSFIATFTYVNFRLAAPPFNLSPAALGSIFIVYLLGVVVTPWTGRGVQWLGRRKLVFAVVACWIAGLLVTLLPSLPAVIAGLAIAAACGFVCQTLGTSFTAQTAREGRSSAVGLYVSIYYLGGSVGGVLPGLTWNVAGWPGAVFMVIGILVVVVLLVSRFWPRDAQS